MKEKTRAIASEGQKAGTLADSVFASDALGGAVVVAAMIDPKIPPLVGD